ncbi:restriction endonuclease [Streptomyces sp. NBC_00825]|uniref:restriction endonuclease n=1 Tax=unclassified Streptomyces TaxID=2593676 RepID=UPI002ED4B060|nr:restriction endonuclease [Streptomyces sp. NBC_00826]WTH89197.1 restriction endonuclease [Streptomyces sp. NBC_00825]WTH97922.1 restriction endonuclease [Streptomyces sp. NBC_00822]
MFDEDGSLDPVLKFILGLILVLAVAKMVWEWLTEDAWHWVSVDVWGWISEDVWGWLSGHPWWFALIILGTMVLLSFVFFSGGTVYVDSSTSGDGDEAYDKEPGVAAPGGLTFKMKQLGAMTADGFEQACADLLARDGFERARRVGGSGDLGADVVAWDDAGRKIVLQCKQYSGRVGSEAVQRFNGTAVPEHHADVAVIVALNGFTKPGADFARKHGITLVGRPELKRWAHGEHLYAAVEEEHSPA